MLNVGGGWLANFCSCFDVSRVSPNEFKECATALEEEYNHFKNFKQHVDCKSDAVSIQCKLIHETALFGGKDPISGS